MSAPTITKTPLGVRTEYRYDPPFVKDDWAHMQELIGELKALGCSPLRLIANDAVRIITVSITENE